MKLKEKVIVIEQLDVFTSIFYYIFLNKEHPIAYYIHRSHVLDFLYANLHLISSRLEKKFIRLNFNDFLGSYCEIKEETGLYANDTLFGKNNMNIFLNSTLNFCGDARYSLAIKKELYNRYTEKRIKTFVFLKKIANKSDNIVFLPYDSENINNFLSEKNQLLHDPQIPIVYTYLLKFFGDIKIIGSLFIFPLMLFLLSCFFLFKGITFRKISKKKYTYAIDSYSYGIDWKRPYHEFFIYNRNDFNPAKILHVFRSSLTDKKTKNLFQRYHYPSTVWNQQKIPFQFFRSRILMGMFIKQLAGFCFNLIKTSKKTFLLIPCLAVIKITVESEIFYSNYQIHVFMSRDEYSSVHIVRTLVAWKNKSHSIGFMHGDYTIPGIETSTYLLFDKYAIYGTFYKNFNNSGFKSTHTEIIGAGIYGLDKTFFLSQKGYFPQIYKEIKKNYKILLIVGTYSGNNIDSCFTKQLLKKYYSEALMATDEFSDYLRIIKPASDELSDHELNEIIQGHERVIVDKDLWIYKLILVSDLTLVIGTTTVGLESLVAGKRVLYYDVYHYPENVYAKYSDLLVAFNYEHFYKNIRSVIKDDHYLDDNTLELIREEHGYLFDGQVVERFRIMCRSLVNGKE
ncbi:hypothetical protein [Methanoplanus endosymbiosus]|uniref:Uncharacterized protein n=1 Tax=Methanoplanus endosymbiosus TaxID=33865 RepID=A0A9E7PQJ5_9EURY|nr:hypothetical protein [Methanoplanus endosymbiosus]UUX91672.1 hypothetical protein L6E24_09850 [Methanoplanus endosymbiosus]